MAVRRALPSQSRFCTPTNGGKPCPVDCVVTKWSKWTACTATCGKNGHQVRKRKVVSEQQHGGRACPILSDLQLCNQHKCPEVHSFRLVIMDALLCLLRQFRGASSHTK